MRLLNVAILGLATGLILGAIASAIHHQQPASFFSQVTHDAE